MKMDKKITLQIPIRDFLIEYSDQLLTFLQNSQKSDEDRENDFNYYTRKETAKRLKISLPTLNEYTKQGIIVGNRLGRRVLYRQSDIESALKAIRTS